jgi:hypothetical protein
MCHHVLLLVLDAALVLFRLEEEEKKLCEEQRGIIKSISDIEKEVFMTSASPASVADSFLSCNDPQMW